MTGKEIRDRVRLLLNDDDEGSQIWDDKRHILVFLNEAVQDVAAIRGDANLDGAGAVRTLSALTGMGSSDTVPLDDRWRAAIVDYVCARCYEINKADAQNYERAKYHFARYLREVTI